MEDIMVGKYLVKGDRYYTKDHEWALVRGNRAWVGITDYAQKELGDVVYVELPSVGEELESGDTMSQLESVKSVSPVYAPLSGTVVEVNEALQDEPHLINESPYEEGWIAVLELKDSLEVEDLMTAQEYAQYIAELVKEEKGEDTGLSTTEEVSSIEESIETIPEEELGYEEKER
ncbi:glycine cleavage system H protein [Thermocrinis albus DSM 14484]|uniref:Glycine cleavage system H protein n=1 Tax=Thermocrinis albus (strain DSM 14484 / JCM 11386 / HI 11/12) TaxID=638303 RepID=D3SLE4_THEAH|nr:glycine cleavage system H protein [Thermocrinis albus DSM 14484]